MEQKNDPVLQGTNGILTVGFIVVLLLCTVGFLIYWILSIQSRALLFAHAYDAFSRVEYITFAGPVERAQDVHERGFA